MIVPLCQNVLTGQRHLFLLCFSCLIPGFFQSKLFLSSKAKKTAPLHKQMKHIGIMRNAYVDRQPAPDCRLLSALSPFRPNSRHFNPASFTNALGDSASFQDALSARQPQLTVITVFAPPSSITPFESDGTRK
ncbi:hypothetical protein B0H12DRAFT_282037 [Mycena haematopus]|nr:hypothetical protein B0H12DRAFT_282037 [Mycena haematopus]